MSDHLSHLTLDSLRLGALPPEQAEAARAHLTTCPRCATTAHDLETAAQAFRTRFEPSALAAQTLEIARQSGTGNGARHRMRPGEYVRRALYWLVPVAVCAVALFVVVRPREPDGVRSKGNEGDVELYLVVAGGEPVAALERVPPGAQLRVRYRMAGPAHVRWLWRDERGAVAALDPRADAPSRPVAAGQHWLDHEIALDAAPEDEQLSLVRCADPVDHARAMQIVSGTPHPGCELVTRTVRKQVTP